MKNIWLPFLSLGLLGCYSPERDCKAFRNGSFTFSSEIDGRPVTTRFYRQDSLEVDYFEGRTDSASVRWINDCEYVVQQLNPKNAAEAKSIHMKILSTTDTSYTFEYNIVGASQKSRGTAIKTD